jgi:hypothetical protein
MNLDRKQKHFQEQKWKEKKKILFFVDKQSICIFIECKQHRVKDI